MKLKVTFKEQNPDFNAEYAKEYHFGEESDGNMKDNWGMEFEIEDGVTDYKIIENTEYRFRGFTKNGVEFDHIIPNMTILQYTTTDGKSGDMAVSNNLLKGTHKVYQQKYQISRIYFYFKPQCRFIRSFNTVFIEEDIFPKELLNLNI